jgi:hypothetical protein
LRCRMLHVLGCTDKRRALQGHRGHVIDQEERAAIIAKAEAKSAEKIAEVHGATSLALIVC